MSGAGRTRRWRERRQKGRAVVGMEYDGEIVEMAIRFGGLDAKKAEAGNRDAVAAGLGRLLRRGLMALIKLEALKKS